MNSPAAPTFDRLIQLSVVIGRNLDGILGSRGLSISRAPVLWVVSASGPQTQRELADALRVSPRNITGLVDGLVADGFVSREPHPSDRRAILVTLTALGESTVTEIAQAQQEFTTKLFEGWQGSELTPFSKGLDRVVNRLHALSA